MGGLTAPPPIDETPPITQQAPASIDEQRISVASQGRLMWWRFRKHRLAIAGGIIIAMFYTVVLFADFFATADPLDSAASRSLIPPQPIHWMDEGHFSPYVFATKSVIDFKTFKHVYQVDASKKLPVHFFAQGFSYKLLGLIPINIHLIGVDGDSNALALIGNDEQGRDVYSRLVYATRTSLTIGLAGVTLSLVLGIIFGAISGFYGGPVDTVIQRIIELLASLPGIPLYMALAAAMPRDWDVVLVYFSITVILSLKNWGGLAREVRGRFLQLREEDFVTAAELAGAGPRRIMFTHMAPLFSSHLIATTTLAFPFMIAAETGLSFIGLGLRPPAMSWGVMLQSAQNVQTVALSPWLMTPAILVVFATIAFNFLGDGLRDAADPYGI